MKARDLWDLVLLGAIWGASFLFMRVAVPEFGPVALIAVRVAIAAFVLLPLLAWRGLLPQLRVNLGSSMLIGVINSALPFVLFAYALLTLSAGLGAILNSIVPLWTALAAWLVLRQPLRAAQWLGLLVGAVGVVVLVWDKVSFKPGTETFSAMLGIGACVLATISYAAAAILARKKLADVDPGALAAGSQLGATLVLLPPVLWFWPSLTPSLSSWAAALALGVICTGLAYLLYFRLLARTGPVNAASVTLLVPIFATVWGALFLSEPITMRLIVGGAIVLLGTALALGLIRLRPKAPVAEK